MPLSRVQVLPGLLGKTHHRYPGLLKSRFRQLFVAFRDDIRWWRRFLLPVQWLHIRPQWNHESRRHSPRCCLPGRLIVHSDRGSQYASQHFRNRLAVHQMVQSMSRRGNCYDNAPMESFFKSYKSEEARDRYGTHEQATRGVSDYIEHYYNTRRLHSSLDYQSPIDFEQATKNLPHVGKS